MIGHVVSDVLSDPQMGALALAKSKLTLAAFSRAQEFEADGIGVGISARAGFDPYGAARFLTDMQRNADLKAAGARSAGPRLSPRIRRRPTGSRTRSPTRASTAVPATASATATNISPGSTAWSMARIRAKASCAAAASCIPSSASLSWRRRASRSTTPRRPCSASRAAARRCGSTWSACRPSSRSATISNPAGWRTSTRQARGVHRQRLPGGDRDGDRRRVVVPPLRRALRQRRLPLHLRRQDRTTADRPLIPRIRFQPSAA